MRNRRALLAGVSGLVLFLSAAFVVAETAYVGPDNGLNLRGTPSLGGAVIKVLPCGEAVTVLERQQDWAKVQGTMAADEGWVLGRYLLSSAPMCKGGVAAPAEGGAVAAGGQVEAASGYQYPTDAKLVGLEGDYEVHDCQSGVTVYDWHWRDWPGKTVCQITWYQTKMVSCPQRVAIRTLYASKEQGFVYAEVKQEPKKTGSEWMYKRLGE